MQKKIYPHSSGGSPKIEHQENDPEHSHSFEEVYPVSHRHDLWAS